MGRIQLCLEGQTVIEKAGKGFQAKGTVTTVRCRGASRSEGEAPVPLNPGYPQV